MDLVQYFIGVLYSPSLEEKEIESIVTDAFGAVELASESYPFQATGYYSREMGENLKRIFYVIKKLESPALLSRFKENSVQLEEAFLRVGGKRMANLDPGYMDAVKVMLASTKRGGHKIAMTPEIYADMVLDYFQGNWRAFDWTFPDFKSGIYFPFLRQVRQNYLKKLKEVL